MKITSDITAALNATHEQRRTLFEGAAAGQPRDPPILAEPQPERNTLMEELVVTTVQLRQCPKCGRIYTRRSGRKYCEGDGSKYHPSTWLELRDIEIDEIR